MSVQRKVQAWEVGRRRGRSAYERSDVFDRFGGIFAVFVDGKRMGAG